MRGSTVFTGPGCRRELVATLRERAESALRLEAQRHAISSTEGRGGMVAPRKHVQRAGGSWRRSPRRAAAQGCHVSMTRSPERGEERGHRRRLELGVAAEQLAPAGTAGVHAIGLACRCSPVNAARCRPGAAPVLVRAELLAPLRHRLDDVRGGVTGARSMPPLCAPEQVAPEQRRLTTIGRDARQQQHPHTEAQRRPPRRLASANSSTPSSSPRP